DPRRSPGRGAAVLESAKTRRQGLIVPPPMADVCAPPPLLPDTSLPLMLNVWTPPALLRKTPTPVLALIWLPLAGSSVKVCDAPVARAPMPVAALLLMVLPDRLRFCVTVPPPPTAAEK